MQYLIRCRTRADSVYDPELRRWVPYHLDWGWSKEHHGWTYSHRSGARYSASGQIEEKHLPCLLRHFGLNGYAQLPPFEEVQCTPPAALAALRRRREAAECLTPMVMQSHRVGGAVLAEEVS
ncbi:MAG: hypothetical protein RLZZ234_423 [Candidatus Parcubacteria bacterium]